MLKVDERLPYILNVLQYLNYKQEQQKISTMFLILILNSLISIRTLHFYNSFWSLIIFLNLIFNLISFE